MVNNGTSPTIEESLKMIEEKLKIQKKGISEKTNVLKENRTKDSSLSKLFKENKKPHNELRGFYDMLKLRLNGFYFRRIIFRVCENPFA